MSTTARIEATKKWLQNIVIGKKLCPFAPAVSQPPKLRIHASNATNDDEIVNDISKEARYLMMMQEKQQQQQQGKNGSDDIPETTLIVLNEKKNPQLSTNFRNFVLLSWRIQQEAIVDNGYAEKLQIVLFHPLATHNTYSSAFEGDDAFNYTIRSPYPTIHLLREIDVLSAVQGGYPDLEGLPFRNMATLRRDGVDVCQRRLDACKQKE